MSQIDHIISVVHEIGSLKDGFKPSEILDTYAKYDFIDQSGHASQGKFLQAFSSALNPNSPLRGKLVAALDTKLVKSFLAKVSSANKYQEITDLVKPADAVAAEDTTTANVAAYPVPIGTKMIRSRKKESVERFNGVGDYVVTESADVDEELKDLI